MANPSPQLRPPVSPPMAASLGMLIAAMVSIQAGAAVAKGVFPIAGPAGVSALRLGFGAVMLAIALQPWKATLNWRSLRSTLVYGVALGAMNLSLYEALARIPLGVAVALEFTGPLALAAFSSRKGLDLIWVGLAASGLLLLTPLSGTTDLDPLGVVFALAAGMCWASYIVVGRLAGAEHGARATALGCLVAAALVIPIGVIQAGAALLDPALVLPGLSIALLSTALPYTLEMIVMGRMSIRAFGVLMSLEPAIGAASGWLFLHQRLTAPQGLAIAVVIAASVGVTLTSDRAAPDA